MGQAVKYAALGVAIAALLVTALSIINSIYPIEVVNNFGSALTSFVSSAGSVLQNVRGCFNYILGSHLPLTICVAFWIVVPFARLTYKVFIAIYRWINQ